jgi:hypothetical protein
VIVSGVFECPAHELLQVMHAQMMFSTICGMMCGSVAFNPNGSIPSFNYSLLSLRGDNQVRRNWEILALQPSDLYRALCPQSLSYSLSAGFDRALEG